MEPYLPLLLFESEFLIFVLAIGSLIPVIMYRSPSCLSKTLTEDPSLNLKEQYSYQVQSSYALLAIAILVLVGVQL